MRHIPAGIALVLALSSCSTIPPAPARVPAIPEVLMREIGSLLDAGTFLQALQGISSLRLDPGQVTTADIDALETRATAALRDAFAASVKDKKYADALRYYRSATAYGRRDLTPGWTEKSLSAAQASELEIAGEKTLALILRLRGLSADSSEDELRSILKLAGEAGDVHAAAYIAQEMKKRGFAAPVAAAPEGKINFTNLIKGTVTIWVNRGIKVEKGVGYPDRVIGSGFFIDSRGYLLTNYHVIKSEVDPAYEGYSRLYIRLSSETGEKIPAKVVGYDTAFDLALIKVELAPEYVFSGFAEDAVSPGDRIYAIGSPAGLEKTVTSGIVSATGRRFLQLGDAYQVDVPLNPGNSGGPLLNEGGEVIGIVFAGLEQFEGLNFAIPYIWIKKVLPQLFEGGETAHPWLGMAVSETEKGLEVIYTMPGGPADRAGILVGDILKGISGTGVSKLKDAQEVLLDGSPAPYLARISYSRDRDREAVICLDKRPENPIQTALEKDSLEAVIYPVFGMRLERIGSTLGKPNYIVSRVKKGSVADESGISENDPLTIQDWSVDKEKGIVILQVYVKKAKQGFLESIIQIGAYLETDSFL